MSKAIASRWCLRHFSNSASGPYVGRETQVELTQVQQSSSTNFVTARVDTTSRYISAIAALFGSLLAMVPVEFGLRKLAGLILQ